MRNKIAPLDSSYCQGTDCKESRKYEEAIRHFSAFLERNPDHPQALLEIGECFESLGKIERAIKFFDRALTACPGDALAMAKKGYAMHYLDPEQREEGKALCEKALSLDPNSDIVLAIVGESLIVDAPARARSLIDKALSIRPQSARALFCKGLLCESEGQVRRAAEYFGMAATTDSKYFDVLYGKVGHLRQMQMYDAALRDLQQLLSFDEDSNRYHRVRGDILADMERWEEAITCYTKAIELDPGDASCFFSRGRVFASCGCIDDAERDYKAAIEREPQYAEALTNLAAIYCDFHEDYTEAMIYVERAIEVNGALVNAWVNRGIILRHLNRLEDAVASYDKALSLDPGNTYALLRKGALLTDILGLHEEALQCFNAVASVAPGNTECWWNLSQVYMHKGNFETAIMYLDRLLEIAPDNTAALRNKAALLQRLGRGPEAASLLAQLNRGVSLADSAPDIGTPNSDNSAGVNMRNFAALFQSFAETSGDARKLLKGVVEGILDTEPEKGMLTLLRRLTTKSEIASRYMKGIAERSDPLLAVVLMSKLAELVHLAGEGSVEAQAVAGLLQSKAFVPWHSWLVTNATTVLSDASEG